jgi:hypothetical protein
MNLPASAMITFICFTDAVCVISANDDHGTCILGLTDNGARAVKLLETHLPVALTAVNLRDRFEFYLAARLLLEILAGKGPDGLSLRLPLTFPLHRPDGRYPVKDLADWLKEQLQDLAGHFDARNGNKSFSRRISGLQRLKKLAVTWRLSADGREDKR